MSAEQDNLDRAATRVDYRLSYEPTPEPRRCTSWGIDGPEIRNAYYGRRGHDESSPTGSGAWDDPDHPHYTKPEEDHIARWFGTAVREAIHEALEWFWVDEEIYLNPHGEQEELIHEVSSELVQRLLAIRSEARP